MARTLAEIAKTLNLGKSFVQNRTPMLFLCGGSLPKARHAPASLRGFLVKVLKGKSRVLRSSVILAEDAARWYRGANGPQFSNLVDLEEQIAALSTLILLIVESSGSIAELGAFSFIPSLRAKLHVILDGSFQYDHSFIMDGPVAMVDAESKAKSGQSRYYTYDWLKRKGKQLVNASRAEQVAHQIVAEILDPAVKEMSKSELFRVGSMEHQMLLVADLVNVSGALLISEIIEMLSALGVSVEQGRVEQYLFLLENLGYLSKTHPGNYDFYVQSKRDLELISFISTEGKPVKRVDLSRDLRNAFSVLPNYDHRRRAFGSAPKRKVGR
ncbi:MAG: retron St85 family effector protein [Terracidiphilus sp.]|jgi:hypothetical protein